MLDLIWVKNMCYLQQFALGMSAAMVCKFGACMVVGGTLRSWGWHHISLGHHDTSALPKILHLGNQTEMISVCHTHMMPAQRGSSSPVAWQCSCVDEMGLWEQ